MAGADYFAHRKIIFFVLLCQAVGMLNVCKLTSVLKRKICTHGFQISYVRFLSCSILHKSHVMLLLIFFFLLMQLTEELSKVDGKLKLTESLLESKVLL